MSEQLDFSLVLVLVLALSLLSGLWTVPARTFRARAAERAGRRPAISPCR